MANKRVAMTDEERAERRKQEQQLTEQAVAQLRCSAGWQRWLTVRARVGLRRYSVRNQLLIALQDPGRRTSPASGPGCAWATASSAARARTSACGRCRRSAASGRHPRRPATAGRRPAGSPGCRPASPDHRRRVGRGERGDGVPEHGQPHLLHLQHRRDERGVGKWTPARSSPGQKRSLAACQVAGGSGRWSRPRPAGGCRSAGRGASRRAISVARPSASRPGRTGVRPGGPRAGRPG